MISENKIGQRLASAEGSITWSWAVVILTIAFSIAGDAISDETSHLFGFDVDNASHWPNLVYVLVASFGATIAMTLAWIVFFERRKPRDVGLGLMGIGKAPVGYVVGVIMLIVVVGVIYLMGGYQAASTKIAAVPLQFWPVAMIVLGFVVQATGEELGFRGWLMNVLKLRFGVWWAVMGNSVLFSLTHAFNVALSGELILGLVNLFLFGVFLSLWAERSGSIWGVSAWHAGWNAIMVVGFDLQVSGLDIDVYPLFTSLTRAGASPWWLTGGGFGPEASIAASAVFLAGIAVQLWLRRAMSPRR